MPELFNNKYILSRYLSSTGLTGGVKNMATTADVYYFTALVPTVINRMIVSYEDGTGGNVSEYGNLGAGLTTGIKVQLVSSAGGVLTDLTDGVLIKTNGDWTRVCYDYSFINHGSGNDYFSARWTFGNSGKPLQMNIGDKLEMTIADDLTNLVSHYALVQGYPF